MSKTTNQSVLPFSNEARDHLPPTGEKIIADRYLQKGGELIEGAYVVVMIELEQNGKTVNVRELGRVTEVKEDDEKKIATVQLADGAVMEFPEKKIDVLKETAPHEMWERIARGVVEGYKEYDLSEKELQEKIDTWQKKFEWLLSDYQYIPGGRINASMGAVDEDGNSVKTTSYNCFVIPNVGPTIYDYSESFKRTLEIQARSGGVGMNMSLVPPQGTLVEKSEIDRSKVQLVMDVWHPDLYDFLDETGIDNIEDIYKHSTKVVRISEEFKSAVENNENWTFEFPNTKVEDYDTLWNGNLKAWKKNGCKTEKYDTVSARDVYDKLMKSGVTIVENILFMTKSVNPGDSRGTIADNVANLWEVLLEGNRASVVLSSLRPRYSRVVGVNGRSSGAYSWGALYDRANWAYAQGFGPVAVAQIMSIGCLLTLQGGSRRGALMIVLNDWHTDIMNFVTAKRDMSLINGANISVAVSDRFMELKDSDAEWELGYVAGEHFERYEKSYFIDQKDFTVTEKTTAKAIWAEMMQSAWASAEPGIIFMERYNKMSNSRGSSDIIATNPCGK